MGAFIVAEKQTLEKMERSCRKGVLVRGLKRADAQDRYVLRLGGKNGSPCLQGKQVSRKMKIFIKTPVTNG